MTPQERREAIRNSLAIAPRPKMDDEKIDALLELLKEAEDTSDDVLLLQVITQCSGALARIHAARLQAQ